MPDEQDINVGLKVFLSDPVDAYNMSFTKPLGVLVAFVTTDDPHSPVMIPAYEATHDALEKVLPLLFLDARSEATTFLKDVCMVHSVPTFCWIDTIKSGSLPKVHYRAVGTVNEKKLKVELEPLILRLLD